MVIDSRAAGDCGDTPEDMSRYAHLRLAELRVDPAGEFWGVFVDRHQPLPSGLVLPLEAGDATPSPGG